MSAKITAALTKTVAAIAAAETKLAELLAKRDAYQAELDAIAATQNVGIGQIVIIAVGRGDTRREVEAIVRALKDKEGSEGVKVLKVEYTSAFTPGFPGVIAFTPDAFSNDFAVIDSTSILRVKEVVHTPVELDEDAELEAQIAAANAEAAAE